MRFLSLCLLIFSLCFSSSSSLSFAASSSHPFTILHSHPPSSSHHHHGHDHDECLSKSIRFGRKRPKKRISSSFLVYSILTIDMVMFSLATTTITTSYRNSVCGFMQWDAHCWREQCWGMLFCTSYHMILVVNIFTHIIIIWIVYMIRFIIMDILNHILILSRIFLLYCLFCVSVKDPSAIVLFLQVEKVVRYVEDLSGKGEHAWGHGHHHHRHNHSSSKKLKDDSGSGDESNAPLIETKNGSVSEMASDMNQLGGISDEYLNDEKHSQQETLLRKHNFTDGMALGGAFLLHGSVGGWSRTLFLLAHELPQEVGDFVILVRSGFSVSKALFFNFLSALVVLAGTALGFTAGGFIYIAVAGVLPEINSGRITFRSTVIQLMALTLGMAVAHLPCVFPLWNEYISTFSFVVFSLN